MRDEDDEWWPKLILHDYLGKERSNPRPFLVFDRSDGKLTIADDYETSNDETARDFGLPSTAAAVVFAPDVGPRLLGASTMLTLRD